MSTRNIALKDIIMKQLRQNWFHRKYSQYDIAVQKICGGSILCDISNLMATCYKFNKSNKFHYFSKKKQKNLNNSEKFDFKDHEKKQ